MPSDAMRAPASTRIARRAPGGDAGFSLIEGVIGLSLISMLLVTGLPLLLAVFQTSAGLGAKEAVIALAGQRLEYVRSIVPANLLKGRYATDVNALTASPGLVNLSSDLTTAGNFDPTATSGSAAAAVPLTSTQVLGRTTYTIRTYINPCYLSVSTGTCTAVVSSGALAYRVSVSVAWPKRPGAACASGRPGQCEYVATTLIDPTSDPVFTLYGTPSITSVSDVTTPPATALGVVHPGQRLTLTFGGTQFASGATVTGTNSDTLGLVTNNTGTSLTVQYQASSTLGTRSLVVTNPTGARDSTTLTVAKSAPTISSMSPVSAARTVATTYTLTGADVFATPSTSTQTTKPTVSLSASMVSPSLPLVLSASNITVLSPTSLRFTMTLPIWFVPYTAAGTLTLTNPDGGTTSYAFSVAAT